MSVVTDDCQKKKELNRADLLDYSFYDDTHKVVAVLNERLLKQFLGADEIILKEYEHK